MRGSMVSSHLNISKVLLSFLNDTSILGPALSRFGFHKRVLWHSHHLTHLKRLSGLLAATKWKTGCRRMAVGGNSSSAGLSPWIRQNISGVVFPIVFVSSQNEILLGSECFLYFPLFKVVFRTRSPRPRDSPMPQQPRWGPRRSSLV